MSSQLNPAKNFFILLLGAGLIGLAPLFVRWSELSPSWILFYRMFLALPFLALINIYFNKHQAFKLRNGKSLLFAMIAAFAFTTDMSAWHWSLQYTSIANSTIIVNTAPIYVAILGIFLFKESVSGRFLVSFVSTYVGVFGLVYSDLADSFQSQRIRATAPDAVGRVPERLGAEAQLILYAHHPREVVATLVGGNMALAERALLGFLLVKHKQLQKLSPVTAWSCCSIDKSHS